MGRRVKIDKEAELAVAGESAADLLKSRTILLLALFTAFFSLTLTIRSYVRCPSGDEWFAINSIARGSGISDWRWLFGQHNEHRIPIVRALIWLDTAAFNGRNVSLYVEIWLSLILHWAAICYVLERLTGFPTALRRTLEGLFGFCIFHPNQFDNLTEGFQIAFVLPFMIGTFALLAATFFARLRRKWLITFGLASAPVLAAWNMAGGFMIGPAVLLIGVAKRSSWRVVVFVFFLVSASAYFWGLKPPDPSHSVQAALADPKGLFVYVLTYFGASWTRILPHKERTVAFLSLVALIALAMRLIRNRRVSDFEWFCFSECGLMVSIAFVTALGRLRFGPGQAFESRYQTPAMLYWGSLGALVMIAIWKHWPARFGQAQTALLLITPLSMLTYFTIWHAASRRADAFRSACSTVINGNIDEKTIRELYARDAGIEPGAKFLKGLWSRTSK